MRHTCFARSVDDDDPISPYQRPRGYGGIAVFIPLQWAAITKNTMDGDHRLSVTTIDLPNLKLCVVNCYLPCHGYRTSYSDYNDCLIQLREIFIKFSPSYEIVLCGDMNATIMKESPDSHDTLLDNFCKDMCFVIPPGSDSGPTFRHPDGRVSRIDFIMLHHSNLHLISEVKYEDDDSAHLNTSDHIALMSKIKCHVLPKANKMFANAVGQKTH